MWKRICAQPPHGQSLTLRSLSDLGDENSFIIKPGPVTHGDSSPCLNTERGNLTTWRTCEVQPASQKR